MTNAALFFNLEITSRYENVILDFWINPGTLEEATMVPCE